MHDTTLIILPDKPFDHAAFERVCANIAARWSGTIVVKACSEDLTGYYHELLPDDDILVLKGRVLDRHAIEALSSDHINTISRVVLMHNGNDMPLALKIGTGLKIGIYRDSYMGFGGLHLVSQNDIGDYRYGDAHIFNIMSRHIENDFIYFPFGYLYKRNFFGDIDDLGFRLPDNYTQLSNRAACHKVIAFFGGSACFDVFARAEERFSSLLEQQLNTFSEEKKLRITFTVLNFGHPSYNVIFEMFAYLLFAWKLNPDVVIAHDGFNDLYHAQTSDPFLQKKYDLFYHVALEQWGKLIHGYAGEVVAESGDFLRPSTSPLVAVKAYYYRKKQFEAIVRSNGALFVSALQPTIYSKRRFSRDEEHFFRNIAENPDRYRWKFISGNMPLLYKKFLAYVAKNDHFAHFINFQELFGRFGEHDTLFFDSCHQLPAANRIIADIYSEYITSNLVDILRKEPTR